MNTLKEYSSITDASRYTGIARSNISNCLLGFNKSAGIIHNRKAVWMYKEDFDKLDIDQVNKKLEDAQGNSAYKGIILLNTLEEFDSILDACIRTKIDREKISRCLAKKSPSGGTLDGIRLVWCYKSEYETMDKSTIDTLLYNADKRIMLVNTGEIFEDIVRASKETGISESSIRRGLKGRVSRKYKADGKRVIWINLAEYNKMTQEEKDIYYEKCIRIWES